jgi:hypothetical protein
MSVNDTSRIVIDSSRVMLPIVATLTDDSRGVIYNRNMFIVQGTALSGWQLQALSPIEIIVNLERECFYAQH